MQTNCNDNTNYDIREILLRFCEKLIKRKQLGKRVIGRSISWVKKRGKQEKESQRKLLRLDVCCCQTGEFDSAFDKG